MLNAKNLRGDEMVVMSAQEYRDLIEDVTDTALLDRALFMAGEDPPAVPLDLMNANEAGEISALTMWRRAAGLTIAQLADKAGVRAATISDIEHGKIDPRVSTVRAIAAALRLDIDDIV